MRQILPVVVSLFMSLMCTSAWALGTPNTEATADQAHTADHAELTKLREITEKAINTRDFESLKPYLQKDNLTVITVDSQKFDSLDKFKQYWSNLFENKTYGIDRIEVKPVADGPTEFLCDTVGVCHGTSNDSYVFKNGDVKVMPERWTAVVIKDDGKWKVSRIIFSANILDNPYVTTIKAETQNFITIAAVAGAIIGILIGALGMSMMRKKA